MPKKYLLYARVSPKGSTWDAGETSIGVQLDDMKKHVLRLDPDAEFSEITDEFKSGKNLKRPGIQHIMASLDRRPIPFDCLVVWNLDRLSRSLCDALPIFSKLRDSGCEFISINQEYLSYTGAMARYMLHQTIAIAELERGMTSERVSAKMRYIAAAGKIPWGNIPLGYVRAQGLKNTVVVDREKAEIVKAIFDMYLSGRLGYEAVNQRWPGVIRNRAHLYNILRQKLYIGELHYAGEIYKTEHPAIIDRNVFEKVQEMLTEKKRKNYTRKGVQKYDYLLSGIIRCHCGRHMTGYSAHGRHGQKFYYYKCTSPTCKNAINAEKLDKEVLTQIAAIFRNENEIRRSIQDYIDAENEKKSSIRTHIADLELNLKKAQKREEDIKQMFLGGIVTPENAKYWNDELFSARSEREKLESDIQAAGNVPEYDVNDIFPDLMKSAAEWARQIENGAADFATKRNLIMSTIDEFECTERTENQINFKMSLIMSSSKKWWAMENFIIITNLSFIRTPQGVFSLERI